MIPSRFASMFEGTVAKHKHPKLTTEKNLHGTAMPAVGKKGFKKVHKDQTKVDSHAHGVSLLKNRPGEPKDEIKAKGKDHTPAFFKQKKGSKGNVPNNGGPKAKKK